MSGFQVQDPDYEARIRRVFDGQPAMMTLGITLSMIGSGRT